MSSGTAEIRSLNLVLTAACNLRCSYCYQTDKKNRRIDWDVVRAALDRLLQSTSPDVDLLFIGGEPLLEFPVIERAVGYVEANKRADMRVRYAIITNGLLLGEEQRDFFAKHRFGLQLSFDGVVPAQRLRGENTFARLDALLDTLRAEHPGLYVHRLRINITLTPATIRWLPESVAYFLIDKEVHDLTMTPLLTAVPDWRPERIDELDAAFERVFEISLERYRRTGDFPLAAFRNAGGEPAAPGHDVAMCRIGSGELDHVSVDVDGQAHGCLMFVESYQVFPTTFLKSRVEALRLGDIRGPVFDERLKRYPETVRRAEIFNRKELKYSSYRRCGECEYLADCTVCPMSMGRTDADVDPRRVPDFYCAYNLISLKYRARFPRYRSLAERLTDPLEAPVATAS